MGETNLKEGDLVTWQSQAQGYHTVKRGVIVAVIPTGRYPDRDVFPTLYKNAGVGMSRDHESYVVKAHKLDPHGRPKGSRSIYWPRANKLTRAIAP